VSDEGTLTRCLGVHFTRDVNGGWTVDNSPYINQVKEKFDQYPLSISPTIPIPTDWYVIPTDWDDYTLDMNLFKHYRSIIGVLIWTVSTLRFDVTYHISVLAQYTTRPTDKLVKAAYRVMGYLVGTPHFNISYKIPVYPYCLEEEQTTYDHSMHNRDNFVSCVRLVLHTMRILENMGSP
jgi:hypothetical protein